MYELKHECLQIKYSLLALFSVTKVCCSLPNSMYYFTLFVCIILYTFLFLLLFYIALIILLLSVLQQAGYTRWGDNFPETNNRKLCVQVRTEEEENIKAAWENKNCYNYNMIICEVAASKITHF